MADSLQTEIAVEDRLSQSAAHPLTMTSDALLVTWAQNGEQMAYVELCRRHREMVFRMVLRITRNADDAEDVLQESWMRAFTHIGNFDRRSAFSTWVARIAINSALTMIRRRRTQRESSLDDPVDPGNRAVTEMLEPSRNPEERCLEKEQMRLFRQAVKRLPPELRMAIEIRQSHDGSVDELAMLAGVSPAAMKSRLMRARLRLRERVSKLLEGGSTRGVSPRTNEMNSARKTSRRQIRSKEIAIARNHLPTAQRSIHFNEVSVTSNNNEGDRWVMEQGPHVSCSVTQEV
jgi:RNA polymerase sigma factor (sigma-70 family)